MDLMSVTDHPVEGFHSGLFADDGEFLNVAARYRLDTTDKSAADPGRPYNDPAYDTQIFRDLPSIHVVPSCDDHAGSYTTGAGGLLPTLHMEIPGSSRRELDREVGTPDEGETDSLC